MTYNEAGELVEDIADSYTVSDDGLTYVFTLKETTWSDGTPLTAADFVYSWNRAANPLTAADYSYLYDGLIELDTSEEAEAANEVLLGVEATGDYELTVTLVNPCSYFLSLCAFPTFFPVPQASVEAADTDGTNPGAWCNEAGFISNGAYCCTAWSHDESMTYTKNENYWDAENVSIETLNFMLSSDDAAILTAYDSGNLDFSDTIPSDEISNRLDGDDCYVVDEIGTYYVGFNVNSTLFEGYTPEQAADLRHALCLLVDRDYIIENIGQTGQEPANAFIPSAMSDGNGGIFKTNTDAYTYPDEENVGYYDASYEGYDDSVAQAIELLEGIGFEFEDGMLSSSTPLSFTYMTNTGTGNEAIAAAIQQDCASIGITVDVSTEDWNVFLDDRKAGNFDVAREGWIADFDDPINMLEICLSTGGNNDMQLGVEVDGAIPSYAPQNWDEFDALIAQIKSEADTEARVALMHEAEDMLMDTWAVLPIYYYNDIYLQKSNVSGIYSNVFATKFFMHATKTE